MKTERRHELEHNSLAALLERLWADVQKYSTAILGTLLALAVVIGAYAYLSSQSKANQARSWDLYQDAVSSSDNEALLQLGDQFPDLPAGQWARITAADIKLSGGVADLFRNRDAAPKQLEEAATLYAEVRKSAKANQRELAERALIGQARAQESLGKVEEALKLYREFAEKYAESPYLQDAEWRIRDLERQSTKKFYDWFATYTPREVDSSLPFPNAGTSLDQVPEEPDFGKLIESLDQRLGIQSGSSESTSTPAGAEAPPAENAAPEADSSAPPTDSTTPPADSPAPSAAPAEPAAPPTTEPASQP